ncbi:MAG: hypothetical protein LBN27_04600 [Prevotellaceae bacterium]|jgi:hypothetical protein|nr:hypothetical protein [Prevotellaceae bacterium]
MLGNIMLHELDKELEARGHAFVRYADDMMLLCKSRHRAERTLSHIVPFIEKLFLRVNRDKTQVAHVSKLKFPGYSFYNYKGKCRLRVHPKSVRRMKERIRAITNERLRRAGYIFFTKSQLGRILHPLPKLLPED